MVITASKSSMNNSKKIQKLKKSNARLLKLVKKNSATLRKVNASQTNPRIKTLRIKKLKALQSFLQAAIMLNIERMKELRKL